MSRKIRTGNDIPVEWSLLDKDENPYIVAGRDFRIELLVGTKRVRIAESSAVGNTIHFTYPGRTQKTTGKVNLIYIENDGKADMVTFDTEDAFTMVPHSWLAVDDDETPETVTIEVVTLVSNLSSSIGPRGYSAYEIAVQNGYVGTEQEWLESLKPDITADEDGNIYCDGELLTDIIYRVSIAEHARQTAEQERVAAETARASAETARAAAEQARVASETTREEAETVRTGNESTRVSNEAQRVASEQSRAAAESDRRSSEAVRQSSEASRSLAENARANAESGRSSAESERSAAETQRSSAETQRLAAETQRVADETQRVAKEVERQTAESEREQQAESDHERAEEDHTVAEEDHEIVEGLDERVTALQGESDKWMDSFKWDSSLVWPGAKKSGGTVDAQVLKTMPTFKKRWNTGANGFRFYEVWHPMMDNEGAEIVLMRYAKKNGKKHGQGDRNYKKGFCLAIGSDPSMSYFVFSKVTQYDDFSDFCNEHFGGNPKRHFGIALRIPNPDYDGPETSHKNATYKGVPESLYSDVLPVGVSYDSENDSWGIGLI